MSNSNGTMSPDEFAAELDVSRETINRLQLFLDLLENWQKAINLVGAESLNDVWRRHMFDSAQLMTYLPRNAQIITDMGSGAGFPGMILSILLNRPVQLIESSSKKVAFLREAARLSGAQVEIHHGRIEQVIAWESDVIVARALAPLTALLAYAEPYLRHGNGKTICLFPKGKTVEGELTQAHESWNMSVERFQSLSDSLGTILRIQDISRDGSDGNKR